MLNIPLPPAGRALAVALALWGCAAAADPPHARATEAAPSFRDWRLDCAAGACAIRTTLRGGDGSAVLTASATGAGEAGALALSTPLPLFLPDGLTLVLGDTPLRAVAWRTCDAAGCEAAAPLDAELLAALRREPVAEVMLTLVDGVRVRMAVSLRGFTAAWEALAAEAPVTPP